MSILHFFFFKKKHHKYKSRSRFLEFLEYLILVLFSSIHSPKPIYITCSLPHLIKGIWHTSCMFHYFVPVQAYWNFQAESTETGVGWKPCSLKRLWQKFSRGRRHPKGHHETPITKACSKTFIKTNETNSIYVF